MTNITLYSNLRRSVVYLSVPFDDSKAGFYSRLRILMAWYAAEYNINPANVKYHVLNGTIAA